MNNNIQKKVGIIVLNYNNYTDTIDCLHSLENLIYNQIMVVVVDNASSNDSVDKLNKYIEKSSINNIMLVPLNRNIGYAGGNNIGIEIVLKNNSDYICILNNDTLVSPNFLNVLLKHMNCNKNIGVCGPVILNYPETNIVQSAGGNINFKTGNVNPLFSNHDRDNLPTEIKCDYVGGACLLLSRKVIEDIGFIPEDYFLFFEETDWCNKIRKFGYDILCFTDSFIWHKGSASIGKVDGLSGYLMERNRMYFIKKNTGFINTTLSFIYLSLRACWRGVKLDSLYFKYILYYLHGLLNFVDSKYKFIVIKKK